MHGRPRPRTQSQESSGQHSRAGRGILRPGTPQYSAAPRSSVPEPLPARQPPCQSALHARGVRPRKGGGTKITGRNAPADSTESRTQPTFRPAPSPRRPRGRSTGASASTAVCAYRTIWTRAAMPWPSSVMGREGTGPAGGAVALAVRRSGGHGLSARGRGPRWRVAHTFKPRHCSRRARAPGTYGGFDYSATRRRCCCCVYHWPGTVVFE